MLDWATEFITTHGYLGIFCLMVLENVLPAIPSEIVLPLVGHIVVVSHLNFLVALLVATFGSMVGTVMWYVIGWYLSADQLEKFLKKYGVYFAITAKDFHKARRFFEKYEIPAVFFGRMIPGIRTIISLPAGSVHMPFHIFFAYSIAGSLVWNAGLMFLGAAVFTDLTLVDAYIRPVTHIIIALLAGTYILQVIRFHLHKRHTTQK